MNKNKKWYLGTIGFSYKEWVGPFYPPGISQREYLSYYSKNCNSVELNTTFHSVPRDRVVRSWSALTPEEFTFSVKTPRRITHELYLQNCEGLMAEFIDSLLPLGEKIGSILIQLPPKFTQDHVTTLEDFFKFLPKNLRYSVEFRHKSWYNNNTRNLLERFGICWVANDYPHLPKEIIPTTEFLYIRWVGVNGMYQYHSYERVDKTNDLQIWLEYLSKTSNDISTIYGYFNNDYAGYAMGTYQKFIQIAGLSNTGFYEATQGSFLK